MAASVVAKADLSRVADRAAIRGQGWAKAGQGEAAGLGLCRVLRSEQDRAGQGRAGQGRAGLRSVQSAQIRAGQGRAGPGQGWSRG